MSESEPENDKVVERPGRRRLPPRSVSLIIGACVVLIAAMWVFVSVHADVPSGVAGRVLFLLDDHAVVNILTLLLSFVSVMTLLAWFTFASGFSFVTRLTPIAIGILSIGVAAATLRISHVSGELIPTFTFRWSESLDRLLGRPSGDRETVDLLTTTEDDFPQFLGPQRNLTINHVKLARDWQNNPPRQLWQQPIGAGWSAFAAVNGFAVTLEQRGDDEMVACYDVITGKMKWWHAIKARHETVMGGIGPRSTPTIHDGKVYALGATGVLRCLDGSNGDLIWQKNLLDEFNIGSPDQDREQISWGRSNSPLIVDHLVVVPAGGPTDGKHVSLVAYDKDDGTKLWEGGDTQISYSSPNLTTIHGESQIVSVNESTVTGHDPKTGKVLWTHEWTGDSNADASSTQPIALPDDHILLTKAYNKGAALLKLTKGQPEPEIVWHKSSVLKTKFSNVAVHQNHAFGLSDGILECVDLQTGGRKWKSGRYGHGQILLVGNVMLVLAESGEVVMVEATSQRHTELGRFRAIEGKTWNNLCLYGRYLLVRNGEQAACYELPVH